MADKITILCSVAADFESDGQRYSITRNDLNLIKEAPAWIEGTLMFKLLAKDGSLKAVTSANRVQAENAPTVGIGADGKAIIQEPAKEEPPKTARKGRQKASVKKDGDKDAGASGQAAEPKIEGEDAE